MEFFKIIKRVIKKIFFFNTLKKNRKLQKLFLKKYKGHITTYYTVITPVYNVEKYLNEYFYSLINQTLDFKKNIKLILIDDGSKDNSAIIIRQWQKKFPKNIYYIKKNNGGLSSARNKGLEYVDTDWVTFIDPDDFIDYKYFEIIDKFLYKNKNKNFALIASNMIYYHEKNNIYQNTHPLKYKFIQEENILSLNNLKNFIQLSASTSMFNMNLIRKQNFQFDEKIRPNFEDAHFVNLFFLYASLENKYFIGFLKNARYYYRQRKDNTSLLDGAWEKRELFSDVLVYGCLNLLTQAKLIKNTIPKYIQRVVLYHLIWYFKYLINHTERISFLNTREVKEFESKLFEIFKYIDINTILEFELAEILLLHKIGLIGRYKNKNILNQFINIEAFDSTKNEVKLSCFYYENIEIDNILAKYNTPKIRSYKFLDSIFVLEKIIWFPLQNNDYINFLVNKKNTIFTLGTKEFSNPIFIKNITKYFNNQSMKINELPLRHIFFRKFYKNTYFKHKFKDAWILMDRDTQADDNAEHLYRYISNNHKDIKIYFIIRKTSHDWKRLQKDGFNLIRFASLEHGASLLNASHLISSHADGYISNYLQEPWYSDILKIKYTFLQHGITKDDMSNWFNSKNFNCLITASTKEYHSIVDDNTPYKFTKKEVVLTGFPRHDILLNNETKTEKVILIIPTWRKSLVGNILSKGNDRKLNNEFKHSEYFKYWRSLLHSRKLLNICQKYGYRIIFFPHINIQPYLNSFNIPKYIETLSHNSTSIQLLFKKASLSITDYSSVAFEMAMLRKETIYYQFDKDNVFINEHIYTKGYFDYNKDAFGPICFQESEVIEEIEIYCKSNGKIAKEYIKKMNDFFVYHDTSNCERTFNAIQNIDSSL